MLDGTPARARVPRPLVAALAAALAAAFTVTAVAATFLARGSGGLLLFEQHLFTSVDR